VLASWLGKDRIMDSLKRFFFSNIQILKFKKGWEKIGLWIPLFDFFQIRNLMFKKKKLVFLMNLLNDSQISKFETSKKARRR